MRYLYPHGQIQNETVGPNPVRQLELLKRLPTPSTAPTLPIPETKQISLPRRDYEVLDAVVEHSEVIREDSLVKKISIPNLIAKAISELKMLEESAKTQLQKVQEPTTAISTPAAESSSNCNKSKKMGRPNVRNGEKLMCDYLKFKAETGGTDKEFIKIHNIPERTWFHIKKTFPQKTNVTLQE